MSNFRLVEDMNKFYSSKRYLKDRDLSILEFNMRVFDQIFQDIPIMEKLNYIYIVFRNLDEFISIKLSEADTDDREWYVHTMESIYSTMNTEFEKILTSDELESKPWNNNFITGVKKIIDAGVYYVYYTSNNEWGIVPYTGNEKGLIERIKLVNHDIDIRLSFYVRFITDKSFQYLYSGESTDEVIGEIKNVVDIKKNAGFQFMQTSCKSKDVMRQFLKYIKLPFIQYIYVEPSLIRCEYIIKKVKSDNPDPKLYFPPHTPLYRNINYKETLLNSDILVYNPYEDYTMILDFINEMCRNKDIVAIFISLYRVAKKSSIVESLITACDLNKDVYVFIEPTARGNEEDNLSNINILTSHGAHVACNYFNYKVHAKMCCAIDTNGIIYAHIGTGNYNEDTAKIYTDFHLLTTNVAITSEIFQLFQSLFKKTRYKAVSPTSFISASPTNFRTKIVSLIDNEREKGELGRIYLKCNSLCDGEIIDRLYNAAQAGVQINIICRTGCSITTHPNIIIKSKVGRFLEHDRIYIFGNRVFISSADLLLRNISKRLELLCEIQSFELKNKIFNAFLDMWNSKQIYVLLENGRWDRKMQSILERITL